MHAESQTNGKSSLFFSTFGSVALATFVSLVWWSLTSAVPASVEHKGSLKLGEQVFAQAGCWYCHHPTLPGQRWGGGFGVQRPKAWWVAYLQKPRVVQRYATKQAFSHLLQKTKAGSYGLSKRADALISYVRYLRGQGMGAGVSAIPQLKSKRPRRGVASAPSIAGLRSMLGTGPSSTSRVHQGAALYKQYCVKCHGAHGRGNGALSKYLTRPPRDLAKTDTYACRSARHALPMDLTRTIRRGLGGCAMIPLGKLLSHSQIKALSETVRKLAMIPANSNVQALMWPKNNLPTRSQTTHRHFQKWLGTFWQREYRTWLRKYDPAQAKLKPGFRAEANWRSWIKWQSFDRWIRKHPEKLHVSKDDWLIAVQRHTLLAPYTRKWRKGGQSAPYMAWLRKVLKKELMKELKKLYKTEGVASRKRISSWKFWKHLTHRSDWLKRTAKRRWSGYLRRKGFETYAYWRERRERNAFRIWKNEQDKWLFLAWRGEKTFKQLGCNRCHSARPPKLPVVKAKKQPARRSHKAAKAPKQAKKKGKPPAPPMYMPLDGVRLRCGSTPDDVYRSIAVGVGHAMPGLPAHQIRRFLGVYSLTSLRNRDRSRLRPVRSLWEVVAYVLFLSRDLPVLQALPRSYSSKEK